MGKGVRVDKCDVTLPLLHHTSTNTLRVAHPLSTITMRNTRRSTPLSTITMQATEEKRTAGHEYQHLGNAFAPRKNIKIIKEKGEKRKPLE